MSALLLKQLSRVPMGVLYGLAYVVYLLLYRVFRLRRSVVEQNLTRAFPEAADDDIALLSRRFYRNYADVLVEMIKSLQMDATELDRRVRLVGADAIKETVACGQSVLVTVAHQSNIEWLLLSLAIKLGLPVAAIYRPISDPGVEAVMRRAYTRFGGELIPDREVIKELMRGRDHARVITIAPDQSPNRGDDTYWTRFLGQETGFFSAPDTIAKFLRLPVFFARMRRVARGQYEVELVPIATPPYVARDTAIVDAYVREVEAQIRAAPADWLWMHRRWKHGRPLYS